MKKLCFILFLFTNIQISAARQVKDINDSARQQFQIDSLTRILSASPDDTLKVIRLDALSNLNCNSVNATSAFALKALSLAEKLHFTWGIALSYSGLGAIYQARKDYNRAIIYFQKAIGTAEKDGYHYNTADFYSGLLNLYFYLGDYSNAMQTITREMKVAEKTNDAERIAHVNNIWAYIYFKEGNANDAEKYYSRYIKNAENLKDNRLLAHALGELSDVYISEKKYKQAIEVLNKTFYICDENIDTAINHDFTQVKTWALQFKTKAFYRLSKVYKLKGEFNNALRFSLESIEYANHIATTKYDIASYYINTGDVYKDMGNFKKAIEYLGYGYRLSREIMHRENTMEASDYLSQTYAFEHKYDSAFFYFRIFTGLKDSIINNATKIKIAGIQFQYAVAKRDKEIARQKEIRNLIIGIFIFILIVIFLLYNRNRLKQKNKLQEEYNRQQNELFNAIISTQDQERKRIAQDLHDGLGSLLSASKLKISSLEESKNLFSPAQLKSYQATLLLLNEASSELRNISHNIMPATLSKLGLEAASKNLIDRISSLSGIKIFLTTFGFESRIDEATEISMYRIILELINNIIKHAGADKITIQLIKYPAYINLTIEDNGKGFNYAKAIEEKAGIGLSNILSRIEYLKGSIDIDSSPGIGTTIIIEIPCSSPC